MDELLGEIVGQRIMLSQLLAFVANQQDDRELFLSNFREASLRSLTFTNAGQQDDQARRALASAKVIIADTCDAAGRAG